MRLIGIVGVGLLVALVSAVVASAVAAQPAYFECLKTNDGRYGNRQCDGPAREPGNGRYERVSAVGTSFSLRTVDREGPHTIVVTVPGAFFAMECATAAGSDEITGPSTSVVQLTLRNCVRPRFRDHVPCQSAGATAGIVQLPQLNGELFEHLKNGTFPEVSVAFAAPEAAFAEFQCGDAHVAITGIAHAVWKGAFARDPEAFKRMDLNFPSVDEEADLQAAVTIAGQPMGSLAAQFRIFELHGLAPVRVGELL